MYRQIMVPLDGSRFAESALPVALSVSRHTGAPVHLVTVQEPVPSFAYDDWERATEEWSRAYLANVSERATPHAGGAVTTALLAGHVVEQLEEEAEARSVDLVVMATHGRGALSRAWLGSVTDSFLHQATRPVLLVRPREDEQRELDAEVSFTKVLVSLDGTPLSESVLEHAVEFGELWDAAYHLIRIVPFPMQFNSPYLPHAVQMNQEFLEEARGSAEEYLQERVAPLHARGLSADTASVTVPQAAHGILVEAEDSGCDIIAMATHARTGLSRALLGSTADKVVRASPVPVLLYRPAED